MSGFKAGERLHVTLRAEAAGNGAFTVLVGEGGYAYYDRDRNLLRVRYEDDCVVGVQPAPVALPTGFGARIAATVTDHLGHVVGMGMVLLRAPEGEDDDTPWLLQHPGSTGRHWWPDKSLSDVEIIDPGDSS